MDSQFTIDYFHQVLKHYQKTFGLTAECIATDMHPDFYPNQYAEKLGLPVYTVQHHEAHLGAVMAEYGLSGKVLGLILDGYGYGHDGEAWGGELILAEDIEFTRVGYLQPMAYISGDKVQREPWRMALALAYQFDLPIPKRILDKPLAQPFLSLLENENISITTSCGRLFDGIASLLGVADINHYEAEAAMRFEALATPQQIDDSGFECNNDNVLLLQKLLKQTMQQPNIHAQATYFHEALAGAMVQWLERSAEKYQTQQIALNGGCFQNRWLRSLVRDALVLKGYDVYIPQQMPLNDGGVSLGQAWICAKKYQQQGN